jgi:hypothetical protein
LKPFHVYFYFTARFARDAENAEEVIFLFSVSSIRQKYRRIEETENNILQPYG